MMQKTFAEGKEDHSMVIQDSLRPQAFGGNLQGLNTERGQQEMAPTMVLDRMMHIIFLHSYPGP
jgi:hypothetical protein